MMGTIDCIYETPCGWCSKWGKKCDKKIPERGQRAKCKPVDDAITKNIDINISDISNVKEVQNIKCK